MHQDYQVDTGHNAYREINKDSNEYAVYSHSNNTEDLVVFEDKVMQTFSEFDMNQLRRVQKAVQDSKYQLPEIDLDLILSTCDGQNIFSIF